MYFVDREKIEAILRFLEESIKLFESEQEWTSVLEKKALERIIHTIIEAVLDVGNAMIDGFIMRDPGSYEDIIDILEDEKVVSSVQAKGLKSIVLLRKGLVQEYFLVQHELIAQTVRDNIDQIKAFSPSVQKYLENELGPVSAFRQ